VDVEEKQGHSREQERAAGDAKAPSETEPKACGPDQKDACGEGIPPGVPSAQACEDARDKETDALSVGSVLKGKRIPPPLAEKHGLVKIPLVPVHHVDRVGVDKLELPPRQSREYSGNDPCGRIA
jgi:hypothetical protein